MTGNILHFNTYINKRINDQAIIIPKQKIILELSLSEVSMLEQITDIMAHANKALYESYINLKPSIYNAMSQYKDKYGYHDDDYLAYKRIHGKLNCCLANRKSQPLLYLNRENHVNKQGKFKFEFHAYELLYLKEILTSAISMIHSEKISINLSPLLGEVKRKLQECRQSFSDYLNATTDFKIYLLLKVLYIMSECEAN